jgi:tripartite-type tricarboxylate transporter receptor subunit TctC
MSGWFAFVAPAKTPSDIVLKLNKAVADTLTDASMTETLKKLGFNPAYIPSSELKKYISDELKRASEIAKKENIVID